MAEAEVGKASAASRPHKFPSESKAEMGKAPVASRPLPTSNTVKDLADGEASAASRPLPASNTVKDPADGEASAASRPLPANNTVKGRAAGEAKAEGVKRVDIDKPFGFAASGSSAPAPPNDKPASANKAFCSPGRFRAPTAKSEYCCVSPN